MCQSGTMAPTIPRVVRVCSELEFFKSCPSFAHPLQDMEEKKTEQDPIRVYLLKICQYVPSLFVFKVFNDNSRILAIKTSGNVFAAEAVEELNFKAKGWNDLLTGEAFTKKVRGLPNHLRLLRTGWGGGG